VAEEHHLVAHLDLAPIGRQRDQANRRRGRADSLAFDSSLTYLHCDSSACLAASFIAKARQVGNPHSLQFALGCGGLTPPGSSLVDIETG